MELELIAQQLNIKKEQAEAALKLLEEGNTVPFIARYRKEMTQGLDEEQIRSISEKYTYQQNLDKRKEDVARLIETQGKLTDEIKKQLAACVKLSQVEDIYRPYQQKRKTRASEAISKGLKPLSEWILKNKDHDLKKEAAKYMNEQVPTIDEALQGASDIIAEMASDHLEIRQKIYDSMFHYGRIVTKEKKKHDDEKKVYRMYYDFSVRVDRIANHNIMAINRAEKEKVITCEISFDHQYCINYAIRKFVRYQSEECKALIEKAVEDGCTRLAIPSIENQIRSELTERAQASSMDVFSMNLEKLLLQPPLKDKVILGFDPAFRTGCKLAVIDQMGKMLEVSVIYPHEPNAKVKQSKEELKRLIDTYHVEVIAIGNGTASRESEKFVAQFIQEYHYDVQFTLVSEAGASVYSASELARKEYPELSVEKRSAISIARRLMDPLCELIKIDPEAIGVGQYQHDLPNKKLKERLHFVVEKAVNLVGVNINTASVELLKNVSGLSAASALSIVDYRESHGKIKNRSEIKKIPKIGAKSFEQAAGFLRIIDSDEILDKTAIHPESYQLTYKILEALKVDSSDIGTEKIKEALENCDEEKIKQETGCDDYTWKDICDALSSPLRDYRDSFDKVLLKSDILELSDLKINEKLQGTVRNVVDFGAFVDIGLHDDGLVHISNMTKDKVSHPSQIVSVGDIVDVWVKKIDEEKQKVQLTMVEPI